MIAEIDDMNLADFVLQMGNKYKITKSEYSLSWYDETFFMGEIYVNRSGEINIEFTNHIERGKTSVYHALDYMLSHLSEEEEAILKLLVKDALQIAKSKRKKVVKTTRTR